MMAKSFLPVSASTFSTELTNVWPEPLMYPHVGVQCRGSVECLATCLTLVWFFAGVYDFVSAQG